MVRRMLGVGTLVLVMAALLPLPAAAGQASWIHVRVDEAEAEGSKVNLNLPLAAAELVLELVDVKTKVKGHIKFDEKQIAISDLKGLWVALRDSGDAELLSVEQEHETVRVFRKGDRVLVHVTENQGGAQRVRVEVPVAVVDALFSGPEDELSIEAAVAELKRAPAGDVMRVQDGDTSVHVWID